MRAPAGTSFAFLALSGLDLFRRDNTPWGQRMGTEEVLKVVGILALPFLGWLAVVAPLMFSATFAIDKEGRESGRQARRMLLRFFLSTFNLWCLTVSLFLGARLLGHAVLGG